MTQQERKTTAAFRDFRSIGSSWKRSPSHEHISSKFSEINLIATWNFGKANFFANKILLIKAIG